MFTQQQKTCICMFKVDLLITAPHCNLSRCSSTNKWLNKVVHLYYVILLSNKKELSKHNLGGSLEDYAE